MTLLLMHVAATGYLTGLIWFVHVVHYPLMSGVGPDGFVEYQRAHMSRTGLVVAPAMLLELATAVVLVAFPVEGVPRTQATLGLAAVGAIWLLTGLVHVPQHRALERGFDAAVHRRLVASNVVRTLLWTARLALVLRWVAAASAARA